MPFGAPAPENIRHTICSINKKRPMKLSIKLLLAILIYMISSCRKTAHTESYTTPYTPPPPTVFPSFPIPEIFGTHYFNGTSGIHVHPTVYEQAKNKPVDSIRIDFSPLEENKVLLTLYLPQGEDQVEIRVYPTFKKDNSNILYEQDGPSNDSIDYSIYMEYDTAAKHIQLLEIKKWLKPSPYIVFLLRETR